MKVPYRQNPEDGGMEVSTIKMHLAIKKALKDPKSNLSRAKTELIVEESTSEYKKYTKGISLDI